MKVVKRIKRLTPYPEIREAEFRYHFDYQGRMEEITYPDGEAGTYSYNRGGEVKSVKGTYGYLETDYVERIGYDKYGQRMYMKLGNGVETRYTYDENRRWLTAIQTRSSYRTLQDMEYTFDRVGNILQVTEETDLFRRAQTYTYDSLYQLTRGEGTYEDTEYGYVEMTSSCTQQYSYDRVGNMRRKRSTNTITPGTVMSSLNYDNEYSYNPDKAKQAERIGDLYYLYAGNGNIIEEREGGHSIEGMMGSGTITRRGTVTGLNRGIGLVRGSDSGEEVYKRTFTWDEENRLKSTVDNRYSVEYQYDYAGKRTNKKRMSGKESLYYNSMWSEVEDSPSFRESKNIYLGKKRIATRLGLSEGNSENYMEQNTYYYHSDHLGSSSVVTDYEGEVYEKYEYTPYGEEWIEKGKDLLKKIPYRFNAKELDSETGLYYYGARYLNPG